MKKRLRVVYDDACPTCTIGKNIAEKLDRHHAVEFVGMHTDEGNRIVTEHALDMERSAYALTENGISQKARMMRAVLAHNGVIGFLVSLPFRIPWLGDRLYELIASHRRHITKRN